MILAVASIKKLSLGSRKRISYQLSRCGFDFKERFDLAKHTLAFNCFSQKLYEDSARKLSRPDVKWLTDEMFVKTIRSGDYVKLLKEYQQAQTETSFNTENIEEANNEAIEFHVTNKPMLRADLKKMKLDELRRYCKRIHTTQTGNKQQLIDKIIDKLVEDEKL